MFEKLASYLRMQGFAAGDEDAIHEALAELGGVMNNAKLAGAAAERERITAILSLPEAIVNPLIAVAMIHAGDVSATEAREILRMSCGAAAAAAPMSAAVN